MDSMMLPFGEGGAMILKVMLLAGLALALLLIVGLPMIAGYKRGEKKPGKAVDFPKRHDDARTEATDEHKKAA